MFKNILALMSFGALLGTPMAAGNLVVNPGFEAVSLSHNWSVTTGSPSCSDWAVGNGPVGVHSGINAFLFGDLCNQDYDIVSQDITTTPGAAYTFSFWVSSNFNSGTEFWATWDGNTVLDLVNGAVPTSYTQYSFTELATTPLTTIAFGGNNPLGWVGLDDVSVDAAAATPEPGTLTVLGLGLAGVGLIRRRK